MNILTTSDEIYRGFPQIGSKRGRSTPFDSQDRTSVLIECGSKYDIDDIRMNGYDGMILRDKSSGHTICNIAGQCDVTIKPNAKIKTEEILCDIANAMNKHRHPKIKFYPTDNKFASWVDETMQYPSKYDTISKIVSINNWIAPFSGASSVFVAQHLDILGVNEEQHEMVIQLYPFFSFMIIFGVGLLIKYIKK